jgi:NitT/TauT family transport system permease protein
LSFTLATLIGVLVAVMLWWSKTLSEVIEPYLIVLNSLPKIALGPLIIIWVGGGRGAIITMALLISVVITIISAFTGFTSVEKEKIDLLRSMGANKLQILFKLILPQNIPNIISILKINVGLSWVGTIMGEYLVSKEGIGYLLVYGSQVFKLDLVMASTILLCILATLMYLIVALCEKLTKKYYK